MMPSLKEGKEKIHTHTRIIRQELYFNIKTTKHRETIGADYKAAPVNAVIIMETMVQQCGWVDS